ncbi:protein kinase [Chloroflexi bacterium]|nr:protein kinase [Chloroflexota bacterium]
MLESIGRYRLIQRIGAGGQATVYSAEDTLLRRLVAVKVMNQLVSSDPQYAETVLEEARFASQLAHRNIAAVYDFIQEQDYVCIVMELIDNSVDKEIEKNGPYEVKDALNLAIQISSALRFAHSKRFVHRDIKPQNILISSDGEAKVADFGMSRPLDVSTATGSIGTLQYMAPEQLSGEHLPDIRSDLYSLGITLYEMLSGVPPFNGNFPELYSMHLSQPPPEFAATLNVPDVVKKITFKLLEKDPDDRYDDTNSLIIDIEDAIKTIGQKNESSVPGSANLSATIPEIICESCGHRNKGSINFCVACGTPLIKEGDSSMENRIPQVPDSEAIQVDLEDQAREIDDSLIGINSSEIGENTWRFFGPHTILGTVQRDEIEHYGILRTVQSGADEYVMVRKNGEIRDVFSEGRRSTRSLWEFALNSIGLGPRVEIFKVTRTRFNLVFWLGEDETLVTGNKSFTFGLPVLTRDQQIVSGKINLWLQLGDEVPENLLLLLRGEPAINKFDIASEIRDDLLGKVLGLDVSQYDWEELRGNREFLHRISESVQREITRVVSQYGLRVQDCSISWGLSIEERSNIEREKHEASLQAIQNINEIEQLRGRVSTESSGILVTGPIKQNKKLFLKKLIATVIVSGIVLGFGLWAREDERNLQESTMADAADQSISQEHPAALEVTDFTDSNYGGTFLLDGTYNAMPKWTNLTCGKHGDGTDIQCYLFFSPVRAATQSGTWVLQPFPPSDEWMAGGYFDCPGMPWESCYPGWRNSGKTVAIKE